MMMMIDGKSEKKTLNRASPSVMSHEHDKKKQKENASEKPRSVRRDWNGIKGRSSKPNNFFRA